MTHLIEISNSSFPFPEIAAQLLPHRAKESHAEEFFVEMEDSNPIVSILYPGKKVAKRPPPKKVEWANLYDFAVQSYHKGVKLDLSLFTFENMLEDFYENKRDDDDFWELTEEIYDTNLLSRDPPNLPGLDSKVYLLTLKWIWIQEDFRYKYDWKEVKSRTRYVRLSKKGHSLSRGAGRAKFFAAMVLLRNRLFSYEEVKKIIPPY
jgi:hypothetical protein